MYQEKIKNYFENNINRSKVCANPKDISHLLEFSEKAKELKIKFKASDMIKKLPEEELSYNDLYDKSKPICRHAAWVLNDALNKEIIDVFPILYIEIEVTSDFPFLKTNKRLDECVIHLMDKK